jgi:hypothetical protein
MAGATTVVESRAVRVVTGVSPTQPGGGLASVVVAMPRIKLGFGAVGRFVANDCIRVGRGR